MERKSHPLPARPAQPPPPPLAVPAAAAAAVPAPTASPRLTPFFALPQPASPHAFFPASPSPRPPLPGPTHSYSHPVPPPLPLPEPEPDPFPRPRLAPTDLGPAVHALPWRPGWTVHYRAWVGPPLLESPPSTPSTSVPAEDSNPAPPSPPPPPPPSTSDRSHDGPPPHKRARPSAGPLSAFDQLLQEDADSHSDLPLPPGAAASAPTPKQPPHRKPAAAPILPAAAAPPGPPLKQRLASLARATSQDPIEDALAAVLKAAEAKPACALVPHVVYGVAPTPASFSADSQPTSTTTTASTTNASPGAVPRTLWVFGLCQDPGDVNPLDALGFPHLTPTTVSGSFSHRTLFPSLYPTTTSSSSSSDPVRPSQLSASAFPSSVHLSSELHSETTTSPTLPFAYPTFLSALSASLLSSLARIPPDATSHPPKRVGEALAFLPRDPRQPATLVSLLPTLTPSGLVLSTSLRSHPLALPPPTALQPGTQVILLPQGTKATVVKTHPGTRRREGFGTRWRGALVGSGVDLAEEEERWVACWVKVPSPASASSSTPGEGGEDEEAEPSGGGGAEEDLEVVWPYSLLLLDLSSSLGPTPDPTTRRRLASRIRRNGGGSRPPSASPVSGIAERVGKLLVDMAEARARAQEAEERDQREREDREKERLSVVAQAQGAVESPRTPFLAGGPINAAQPINMRTPISLQGSSTEAPSPADGFVASLFATASSVAHHPIPVGGPPVPTLPSPALGSSGGPVTTTAAPAMALEPSFDFEWDDFGSAGHDLGPSTDFDDGMGGMMLGLTDDDFSFFDDPPPAPPPLPPSTASLAPQSAGPSPKFVDHFAHLVGAAGSPSTGSPFAGSPQHGPPHHVSPLFGFDHPTAATATGTGTASAASPFKPRTPFTPYSPFVDSMPLHPVDEFAVALAGPTPRHFPAPAAATFDPVAFAPAHDESERKYDPRKGKFGLPSPAADDDDDGHRGLSTHRSVLGGKPWFATVCDPRVAAAGELRRRKASEKGRTELGKHPRLVERRWVRTTADGSGDEMEPESSDEGSDEEGSEEDDDAARRGTAVARLLQTDYEGWLEHSLGPGLLLLRDHLGVLLAPREPPKRPPVPASKATSTKDAALDAAANVFVDQMVYNPDFRARATDALLPRQTTDQLVSARAIQTVHNHLARFAASYQAQTTDLFPCPPPPLVAQTTPAIRLRAQQAIMEVRTTALRFWRPMGFEPLTGPKDVTAFAIFEDGGEDLAGAVKGWLHRVSEAYQASRLGRHLPGTAGSIEDGLATVPAGSLSHSLSYSAAKDNFRTLCSHLSEAARSCRHVVVYLLTPPGPLPTSPASPVSLMIQALVKSKSASMSLVVYPVPLSSVFDSRTMLLGESTATRLDRLVFSVFDQLLIPVAKLHFPIPETFVSAPFTHSFGPSSRSFQFPAITLSPVRRPQIQFELTWPPSSLEVMHRHRILHVGYTAVPVEGESNLEWLVASCIDEKGEVWKMVPKLIRCPAGAATEMARSKLVWAIARSVADAADVEWRIVICRLGLMTKVEMKAWNSILKDQLGLTKRPLHVTLACSDVSPSLSVVHISTVDDVSRRDASAEMDTEEGEVQRSPAVTELQRPPHLQTQSFVFAFTPPEPSAIGSGAFSAIVAPSSTYLIHVPRIASLAHTFSPDPLLAPAVSPSLSVFALHVLASHASRTSSLSISLEQHLAEIRQSFAELSALGQVRWGTNGRIPWHLDAIRTAIEILLQVKD